MGVSAAAGDRQITISWTPVDTASSYNLYFASQPGVTKNTYTSLSDGSRLTAIHGSPHTIDGLANRTTYYVVVTAINAGGESTESAEVSATPGDMTAPTITSVDPADGSTDVDRHATITVEFSEAMNASTINGTTVLVTDADHLSVSGTVTYDAGLRTAEFGPSAKLDPSTTYTVTLTAGITDTSGNPLVSEYQWTFTTRNRRWGEAAIVDNRAGSARDVKIASDGSGTTIAVWSQYDGSEYSLYSSRDHSGSGWEMPILLETLTGNGANDQQPQIVANASGQAVVWWYQWDNTVCCKWDVWANYFDPTMGWTGQTLIENSNDHAIPTQMAIDQSGNVTAILSQSNGTYAARYEVRSGWSSPAPIANVSLFGNPVRLVVDVNGNATVLWRNSSFADIWAVRYDARIGWEAATSIGNGVFGNSVLAGVDTLGNVLAVWDGFGAIFSRRYEMGIGWGAVTTIATTSPPSPVLASLIVDKIDNATVFWGEWQNCGGFSVVNSLWSARYTFGVGWDSPTQLTQLPSCSGLFFPSPLKSSVDGSGNIVALWTQADGTETNLYSARYEANAGWSIPAPIESNVGSISQEFQIAMNTHGDVLAVWLQTDGVYQSVWSSRYQNGLGWQPATLIEDNLGIAFAPQVVLYDNGDGVVIWRQSDGTYDRIWANRFE